MRWVVGDKVAEVAKPHLGDHLALVLGAWTLFGGNRDLGTGSEREVTWSAGHVRAS